MKKKLAHPLLKQLMEERGKLCVSIIAPLYKIAPEKSQNPARVKNAVEETKEQLKKILLKDKKQAGMLKKISASLDELHRKINFIHSGKGIGIFVSEKVNHIVYFPFDVEQKIIIGDSFEVRDMLYKEHYLAEYLVLVLSLNSAKLFIGRDGMHNEVSDENFPKEYKDDFIYNKPSRASSTSNSLKNPEKDKSISKIIHLKEFYRTVDAALPEYLKENVPIMISGVAKCLSCFLEITKYHNKIIGQVAGNYSDTKKEDFETKTWKKVLHHQRDSETALIKELENKVKTRGLVTGIREVWRNAEEGKGLLLVVEKDFRQPGFQKPGSEKIYAKPANIPGLKVHEDAVDDLIEMVLEKNGTVSFVKNGALKKMQRIALVTRY